MDFKGWSDYKPGNVVECTAIPLPPYDRRHFTIGKAYKVYLFENDQKYDARDWYSIRTDAGSEIVVNHYSFTSCLRLQSHTTVFATTTLHYKPGPRAMALSHKGAPCTEVVYEFGDDGKCRGYANNDRSTLEEMPAILNAAYAKTYLERMGWVEVASIVMEHVAKPKTECWCGSGTEVRCQGHSTWCKLYMKEF